MGGDYPSSDFEIVEEGGVRRVFHIPTGITLEFETIARRPDRGVFSL